MAKKPPNRAADTDIGALIHDRRVALGLTLQGLAQRVECARSYLSEIENGRRTRPPGDALLDRLERILGLPTGRLLDAARWQRTPASVRLEVSNLRSRRRDAARLVEILATDGAGRSLDEAWRSGELQRLVSRLAPEPTDIQAAPLPMEVPLINNVAAGYPREFTDLGYPARVADEYVRSPDLSDPDAFAARVVGDSMEPAYHEGDIVIFSPSREVVSGDDCFVRLELDAETTFKRVYFQTDEDGHQIIRLQPLNSVYPPRLLPRERVGGLYRAVSVTRAIG